MSTYQISNIAANNGYAYDSVYSGSLTGTITANTTVTLKFKIGIMYLWNYGNAYPLADTSEWDTHASGEDVHSGDKPVYTGDGLLGVYHRGGSRQDTLCPTPINLTNYSSIVFLRDVDVSAGGNGYCGLAATWGNVDDITFALRSEKFGPSLDNYSKSELDISALTGDYYLMFSGYKGGWCYYTQIYLTP